MASLSPEVRAFLEEPARFATLATLHTDNSPQQTVMWFRLDGEMILMNTARGRVKDRNLLHDSRASVCIEDGYRYVAIAGHVQIIDDDPRTQSDIESLATKYQGPEQAATMVRETFAKQERVTLLLSIDRVDAHGF